MHLRRLSGAIAAVGLLLTLAACGGDDSSATDGGGSAASSAPSEGAGPGQGGPGGDPSQFAAIQQCLEAAGLGDEFPTDMPTDRPSDFPTDGTPPSGFPSDGPGGGGPGGAGGLLQDPDVQAALKACGIEVPTGRPSGAPSQPAS